MEHLERIEMAAKDLIKYHCPDYSFVWDHSKQRKGECRYGVKQIGISRPLAELNTFENMLLTIIHEIAHALTKSGHNRIWKALCLSLGGDGERTYSSANTVIPRKNYIGQCPGCNKTIHRFRRSKIACGRCCKGVYNEAYLIQWQSIGQNGKNDVALTNKPSGVIS